MYARSTTIRAKTSSIDNGLAHLRDEVMPALMRVDGCVGLSMLVDRESGRCIATSSWRDEKAMRASEQTVRSIRDTAAQKFGGTAQVEEWEIAVLHRDHDSRSGACVRATWLRVQPDQVDRAIEAYRSRALPMIEDLDGFCSASLLVDRASGRSVTTVAYDSQDALRRSRDRAAEVRNETSREAGAQILDVAEFELALAHLRVPEMA
jgi:quinol monooxygenase YgiN